MQEVALKLKSYLSPSLQLDFDASLDFNTCGDLLFDDLEAGSFFKQLKASLGIGAEREKERHYFRARMPLPTNRLSVLTLAGMYGHSLV